MNSQSPALSDMLSLKGRRALVVGGAGLLGSQISEVLAELGATVVVASRDAQKCQSFIDGLKARHPGDHGALQIDMLDAASVKACIQSFTDEGPMHILVNCAWSGAKNSLETIDEADWTYDIDMSLNASSGSSRRPFPP